jgi:hypothetical protein
MDLEKNCIMKLDGFGVFSIASELMSREFASRVDMFSPDGREVFATTGVDHLRKAITREGDCWGRPEDLGWHSEGGVGRSGVEAG